MKHSVKVTFILIALFLLSQVIGLIIVNIYMDVDELPLNIERPDLEPQTSLITIVLAILIATAIAILLLKFELFRLWKLWFFISMFLTMTISFSAFGPEIIAIPLALGLAIWKVFKPNLYVHNFTEPFVYGAIAAIFVPMLTITTISIMLLIISLYDYIAVRKTKHMVALAKSQSKAKVFAGLVIPYKKSVAILGGGDMGFPLIFAGVAMMQLNLGILDWKTYIIPFFAMLMLLALFLKGDKKKFYPAMPYISLGCFLGLGILLLVI
jgi:presenilin-like A22 family membrane protease